jgi:eukaryotic-like serine/threonine-protein kinase
MKLAIPKYFRTHDFKRNLLYALGILIFFLVFTMSCIRIYTHHGKSYTVPDFSNMTMEEAIPKLKDKKLRYEIIDSIFIADKVPGVIIDQHPKGGLLVKKNRKIFFTINASAPDKIQMPNLIGITLREGRARLESFGLVLGKLSYRYDISKNVILEQRINGRIKNPGDSVSKGTEIELVLGKGLADEKARVPDLIGLTIPQAKEKALDALFSIGAVIQDENNLTGDDAPPVKIYRQRPESSSDAYLALGSAIAIWVSNDSITLSDPTKGVKEYVWPELKDDEKDTTLHITHTSN